jgi:hypothetical protein
VILGPRFIGAADAARRRAILVGQSGLEAVYLADLGSPQRLGLLDLGGTGQAIAPCGDWACVSKAPQGGTSLLAVDVSSPLAPRALGSLGTPGVSRSLGVKTGGWVYLSDREFGQGENVRASPSAWAARRGRRRSAARRHACGLTRRIRRDLRCGWTRSTAPSSSM